MGYRQQPETTKQLAWDWIEAKSTEIVFTARGKSVHWACHKPPCVRRYCQQQDDGGWSHQLLAAVLQLSVVCTYASTLTQPWRPVRIVPRCVSRESWRTVRQRAPGAALHLIVHDLTPSSTAVGELATAILSRRPSQTCLPTLTIHFLHAFLITLNWSRTSIYTNALSPNITWVNGHTRNYW